MLARLSSFYNLLHQSTSIGTMVYARIIFGLIMIWEVFRYFGYGWIERYYIKVRYNFTFFELDWLKPLPGDGMYYVFALVGVLAFFILIGFLYRISIILFTILFAYIFFLEKAHYLNHFYYVLLVSIALCFSSPHRLFSVDAKLRPHIKSFTIPNWQPWLICLLMGIVYFYGGIAKINPDWLNGNPLYFWVKHHGGPLAIPEFVIFMSWSGMLYDLLIGFMLAYRKTRYIGTIACITFHTMNAYMFNIGIFPWLSLGLTFMFYSSDWPLRVLKIQIGPERFPVLLDKQKLIINSFLTIFIGYNLLMPFRHHFYSGEVFWNELGHRYSWRMKLRSKRHKKIKYKVVDNKTGKEWFDSGKNFLTKRQRKKMGGRPDMIIQFAHHLKKFYGPPLTSGDISIYVQNLVSINYRNYNHLIDPNQDLLKLDNCNFCSHDYFRPFNLGESRTFSNSRQLFKDLID